PSRLRLSSFSSLGSQTVMELLKQRNAPRIRRAWKRFEKRVYISQFLIRNNLSSVGRHFILGITHVRREFRERDRIRAESWSGTLSALALIAVTLITTIVCIESLAAFRVSRTSWRCSLCGAEDRCHYDATAYANNLHVKLLNAVA